MSNYYKTLKVTYLDSDGNIKFGFKNGVPKSIKNSNLLIQEITIRLFTEIGSNTFDEEVGVNLQSLIGYGYNNKEMSKIKMDFINLFDTIENQIKTKQAVIYDSLPYSQRLIKLNLISLNFVESTQSFEMTLNVVTESGSEYTFNVVI